MPLNLATAIVLALFGIIPVVIYFVAGNNRSRTASLLTSPMDGATQVELTFRPLGADGRIMADRFFARLGASELDGAPPSRALDQAARASAI